MDKNYELITLRGGIQAVKFNYESHQHRLHSGNIHGSGILLYDAGRREVGDESHYIKFTLVEPVNNSPYIRIQPATQEHVDEINTWLHPEHVEVEIEAPYDGYGLTGNSEGQFWIIGNRNGNESCFIDLSTADETCLDTSDENQFLVKVFHNGRISRFNTTRVQWNNFHNTINGRLVRYDLNASKPNTPEA